MDSMEADIGRFCGIVDPRECVGVYEFRNKLSRKNRNYINRFFFVLPEKYATQFQYAIIYYIMLISLLICLKKQLAIDFSTRGGEIAHRNNIII